MRLSKQANRPTATPWAMSAAASWPPDTLETEFRLSIVRRGLEKEADRKF